MEHFGLYAGSYGLALERLLLDPVQVVVVGSGPEADRLEATAVARFAVNKTVMRIAPSQLVPGGLPEALAETLLQVPRARRTPKRGHWSAADAPACRPSPMPRRCSRPWNSSLNCDARPSSVVLAP